MLASTFAVVFIALYVGHQVGDHWVQSNHQASTKGCKSHAGRMACLAHVATLHLAIAAALAAVAEHRDRRWLDALGDECPDQLERQAVARVVQVLVSDQGQQLGCLLAVALEQHADKLGAGVQHDRPRVRMQRTRVRDRPECACPYVTGGRTLMALGGFMRVCLSASRVAGPVVRIGHRHVWALVERLKRQGHGRSPPQ